MRFLSPPRRQPLFCATSTSTSTIVTSTRMQTSEQQLQFLVDNLENIWYSAMVCLCVCVCVRARACACVCVCACTFPDMSNEVLFFIRNVLVVFPLVICSDLLSLLHWGANQCNPIFAQHFLFEVWCRGFQYVGCSLCLYQLQCLRSMWIVLDRELCHLLLIY